MAIKKPTAAARKQVRKQAHVSLYLRPVVRSRIDELADVMGMTKSAVISTAIDELYLSRGRKERDKAERKVNGSKAVSLPGKAHFSRYLRGG